MPDIADPENTIIITLKGGDVVVQLLADVAPAAHRPHEAAGPRRGL